MRFAGQWYDRDAGLVYNHNRWYDSRVGRYLRPDPLFEQGQWQDPYMYVRGNPYTFSDPLGLAWIIFWDPVGYGRSSFGHVSTEIGGESFSWGSTGMDIRPFNDYAAMNQKFRGGKGYELNISAEQEAALQSYLGNYANDNSYWCLTNNCIDPLETFLENLGYDLGINITPQSFYDALKESGVIGCVGMSL